MSEAQAAPRANPLRKAIPWLVTLACFTYLYFRIDGAARAQGSSAIPYLISVFADVS